MFATSGTAISLGNLILSDLGQPNKRCMVINLKRKFKDCLGKIN